MGQSSSGPGILFFSLPVSALDAVAVALPVGCAYASLILGWAIEFGAKGACANII